MKQTKKDVKWALKTIKIGEIFTFYHKILSLNFDLRPLKMNTYGINFARDYQKDSYNFKNLMGKKFKR
jgi:hypothetical protein